MWSERSGRKTLQPSMPVLLLVDTTAASIRAYLAPSCSTTSSQMARFTACHAMGSKPEPGKETCGL